MRKTVDAKDRDVLDEIYLIDEGDFDGWDFDTTAEIDDDGYLVSIGATGDDGKRYDVSIRMAEPVSTYREIFATEWDEAQVELVDEE